MESADCRPISEADQLAASSNMSVKCEPLVKEEPEWGASEVVARADLYEDHEIKVELVLGPEILQQQDVAISMQNVLVKAEELPCELLSQQDADATPKHSNNHRGDEPTCSKNLEQQFKLRHCFVRLQRISLPDSCPETFNCNLKHAYQQATPCPGLVCPSAQQQSRLSKPIQTKQTMANKTTLGDLAAWASCPLADRSAFEAIVVSVENNFPSDWRSWEVLNLSYQELFGEGILPSVENKIRFALPTTDLARAFLPAASSLSERRYRAIRARLLQWPLGRALLYAPRAVMDMIHGSGKGCLQFMETVRSMKYKQITRQSASIELRASQVKSSPHSLLPEVRKRKRPQSLKEKVDSLLPPKRPTVGQGGTEQLVFAVLNQQTELLKKFLSNQSEQNKKIEKLLSTASQKKRPPPSHTNLNGSFNSLPDSTLEEQVQKPASPQSWTGSSREAELRKKILEARRELAALHSERQITTTDTEPKTAQAEPIFVEQGIRCQRFGVAGRRNIKYSQASPAFCASKDNTRLAMVSPQWKTANLLKGFELMLGEISHGLLQQRRLFKESCKRLHRITKGSIKNDLLKANSKFKKISNDLLQYVSGRRAEAIEARRDL